MHFHQNDKLSPKFAKPSFYFCSSTLSSAFGCRPYLPSVSMLFMDIFFVAISSPVAITNSRVDLKSVFMFSSFFARARVCFN